MRRFERAEQLPPALRARRTYLFGRRVRDLPLRRSTARPTRRSSSSSTRALAFQPRAELVDRGRRPHRAQPLRRRRAAVCRVGRMIGVRRRRRRCRCRVRVVVGVALAVVITILVAAAARHPARLGHRAARRRCSAGALAMLVALGLSDWDWGADGLVVAPRWRSASRRRWPPRSPLDLLARPGFAGASASAPASSSRPARCGRCGGASPCCAATGSSCGSPAARGSGRSSRRRSRPSARSTPGGAPRGACSRRPAASTSSSGRSPPRASTCCRPTSATSSPTLQNRVPPEPRERIARRARGRARRRPSSRSSPSSTGSRSPPPRSDRPTAPGCTPGEAVVVKVQRPGIEAMMERDLAALALLADLAQRRTAVRSGHALG